MTNSLKKNQDRRPKGDVTQEDLAPEPGFRWQKEAAAPARGAKGKDKSAGWTQDKQGSWVCVRKTPSK